MANLFRLEFIHSNSQEPEGIYQYCSTVLDDYCGEVWGLPVPEISSDITEEYGSIVFWFTELGWKKFGTYFSGLVFEPEAYEDLIDNDFVLQVGVIEYREDYTVLYEDKYQVGLTMYDSSEGLNDMRPLMSGNEWKEFERRFNLG